MFKICSKCVGAVVVCYGVGFLIGLGRGKLESVTTSDGRINIVVKQ